MFGLFVFRCALAGLRRPSPSGGGARRYIGGGGGGGWVGGVLLLYIPRTRFAAFEPRPLFGDKVLENRLDCG